MKLIRHNKSLKQNSGTYDDNNVIEKNVIIQRRILEFIREKKKDNYITLLQRIYFLKNLKKG